MIEKQPNAMTTCLFCRGAGPFSTIEHVVPESLGNDELVLTGEVCDECQAYFGKEVERFVLSKSPLAFWRCLLGIRTKAGRLPTVSLSQPARQKGTIPATHSMHDDGVGFTAHEDGSTSIDIDDPQIVADILSGRRDSFRFVLTPKLLHMLARFLLKIGVELVATHDSPAARSGKFDDARLHARFGSGERLWPIFHSHSGDLAELRRIELQGDQPISEEILCYEYALLSVDEYTLLRFRVGTDIWVVSLSTRYPDPRICSAFPGQKLRLLWYGA